MFQMGTIKTALRQLQSLILGNKGGAAVASKFQLTGTILPIKAWPMAHQISITQIPYMKPICATTPGSICILCIVKVGHNFLLMCDNYDFASICT